MESAPSIPENPAAASPFHKAASYAVFALLSSFVLQFVYTKFFWLRLSERSSAMAGYVPLIVMLSAVPAGFIALCGIPKYGRKRLLWKGLTGLFIPFILVWVSIQVRAVLVETVRDHPEWLQSEEKPDEKP
jgi:hypothetical protein